MDSTMLTTPGVDAELFVPGRVCLFGEHSDWAGSFRRFNSALKQGRTLVVGTNQGLYARARVHPSSLIVRTTTEHGDVQAFEIAMSAKALLACASEGGYFSYTAVCDELTGASRCASAFSPRCAGRQTTPCCARSNCRASPTRSSPTTA